MYLSHSFFLFCDRCHIAVSFAVLYALCSQPVLFYLASMVFALNNNYPLPDTEHGLGVLMPSRPQSVRNLQDSDPFRRLGNLKRTWSQRSSVCGVLPIHAHRSQILSAIARHQVVLLVAPPASGKSSQGPQMVLDDALARGISVRIAVSNPKTLGVMGCSDYVSFERGEASTPVSVGYSTKRQKYRPNSLDSIVYVTEGTLLNILDNALFTHIFIDEVHERTVEVDVLLMQLRNMVQNGSDVKIIIMSATVDKSFIQEYFVFNSSITLMLPSNSHPIQDYWLNDLPGCPPWKCPSQVICQVYTNFQRMTRAQAILFFLHDKQTVWACEALLASSSMNGHTFYFLVVHNLLISIFFCEDSVSFDNYIVSKTCTSCVYISGQEIVSCVVSFFLSLLFIVTLFSMYALFSICLHLHDHLYRTVMQSQSR